VRGRCAAWLVCFVVGSLNPSDIQACRFEVCLIQRNGSEIR
jgi:hypothetical protein